MQAADWSMRLRENPRDERLRAEFDAWADAAPDRRLAFERVEQGWARMAAVASHPEVLTARRLALGQRGRRRSLAWPLAASIAVVACLGAVGAMIAYRGTPAASPPAQATQVAAGPPAIAAPNLAAASSNLYTAAVGGQTAVVLSDGSVLTLKGDSQAVVTYSDRLRLATVQRGDATFEVAKGLPQPFVVHAGDRRITAHGTTFRVRLLADRFSVALIEGSIEVRNDQAAAGGRSDWLKPGQELSVPIRGEPEIHLAHISEPSQAAGKLIFDDTPLSQAVNEANRHGGGRILIPDPEVGRLRVSGVFIAGQQGNIAQALSELYGLRLAKTDSGDLELRPSS